MIRGRWICLVLDFLLPLCIRNSMLIPACRLLVVLRQTLSFSLPCAATHFLMTVLPRPAGSLFNTIGIWIGWCKGELSYPSLFQHYAPLSLIPSLSTLYIAWAASCFETSLGERNIPEDITETFSETSFHCAPVATKGTLTNVSTHILLGPKTPICLL